MLAYRIGIGVAGVDEVPLSLAQLPAFAPVEVDALPCHLLALLAHLLALARSERIEKILEIPVASIEPVKLAPQALQPAFAPGDHAVGEDIGEIHMHPGKSLAGHPCGQAIEQPTGIRRVPRQQTRTGHRRKRHGRQQLGIIGDARALAGISPGPVEHVLAARMALQVGRHGREQLTIAIAQQSMGRLPAAAGADTAAFLQGGKKGMAQERLTVGQQGIPLRGWSFIDAFERLDRHRHSLNRHPHEKNPAGEGGA
ncbi:hypothetical protein D3C78_848140 [compost metagenome]